MTKVKGKSAAEIKKDEEKNKYHEICILAFLPFAVESMVLECNIILLVNDLKN